MNRRKLLAFLGLAPVAAATRAVAEDSMNVSANRGAAMQAVLGAFSNNDVVNVSRTSERPIREMMGPDDDLTVTDESYKVGGESFTSTRIKVFNFTRKQTFYVKVENSYI